MASALPLAEPQVPSRYRVHRLVDPKVTERGVLYRLGERRFLLGWASVKRALAAAVGADESVRVVFDLAVEVEGAQAVACRLDAPSGPAARALARAIRVALGPGRCDASLCATADEGRATRRYPDVDTFDDAALEILRFTGWS